MKIAPTSTAINRRAPSAPRRDVLFRAVPCRAACLCLLKRCDLLHSWQIAISAPLIRREFALANNIPPATFPHDRPAESCRPPAFFFEWALCSARALQMREIMPCQHTCCHMPKFRIRHHHHHRRHCRHRCSRSSRPVHAVSILPWRSKPASQMGGGRQCHQCIMRTRINLYTPVGVWVRKKRHPAPRVLVSIPSEPGVACSSSSHAKMAM
ncbi:hypothetical protein GQ54DRAFT_84811 [Martensiomyces pterosporus]|nr:hypothetical protein GQ54DRAFT_84811 [Martensiomyces pterosporus]